MKMKFSFSPSSPSFPALLLIGFVLVATPLLGGILNMSLLLEKMTRQGQASVTLSAEATLASRQLAEAERALQRAAGLYFVLGDPALKRPLNNAHLRFVQKLNKLLIMPWEPQQQQALVVLGRREAALFTRLQAEARTGAERFKQFKTDFDQLNQDQVTLEEQVGLLIQRQVDNMNSAVNQVRQAMIWQAIVLVLLSAMLAAFLAWYISRPVQQLAAAILRLGKYDLKQACVVRGPRDMVYLGAQLDWLRRRLQELEASKLRFFREVSHELKTPLTSLLEAVSLLRDEVVGELTGPQAEIVGIMVNSASALQKCIEDLLGYNQALRHADIKLSWFSLPELIGEVLQRFDLSIRAKHLQLHEKLVDIRIFSSQDGLSIALENLISNAVKFSPDGGVIEVRAEVILDKICLTICDQGRGVPPSEVSQLFQPFFMGSGSIDVAGSVDAASVDENHRVGSKLKGSGLGLAIAKAHIEEQGGQLELVSIPAWGACFQIRIPLREETHVFHLA